MDGYRRGGHTKYSLKAHIIFVTKYRRRIFDREPEDRSIKELMHLAAESYDLDIIRMETDGDNIHMLIDFRPDMTISDIVKYMKQYSTYYTICGRDMNRFCVCITGNDVFFGLTDTSHVALDRYPRKS